jgi:hypothetical protein
MKREIREVDHERGIVQITTADERFYARRVNEGTAWDYVPSVTWIADHYPKGIGFMKWLASKGWDEAEAIKHAAGEKGSKVHQGIGVLLAGGTVCMEDAFENPRSNELEPLTPAEYECLMSFGEWFAETKPEVIAVEYTVWNERYHYAGTVDLKCRINGKVWIIDFKTSAEVWPSSELQVSAYLHADPASEAQRKKIKLAILQVGYRRNKKRWKWTPVADQFKLFLAARQIWEKECAGVVPLQRDYPMSLSLGMNPPADEAEDTVSA